MVVVYHSSSFDVLCEEVQAKAEQTEGATAQACAT